MSDAKEFLKHMAPTGALAAFATTAILAILGKKEDDDPAGPINAVSHIVYGDEEADTAEGIDAKHTLVGGMLNAASVAMWSGLHELLFGRLARKSLPSALVTGAATAGIAYVVDYYVVPKRLTPGFEKKLSPGSMLLTYATLAGSLAIGSFMARDKPKRKAELNGEMELRPPHI